jgi:hypothetical protein
MTNSYFKVTADKYEVFFFDTNLKETVEEAWSKAYASAESYLLTRSKIKNVPASNFISTWKKPHESGPWSSVAVVGEYNMSMAYYMAEGNLN